MELPFGHNPVVSARALRLLAMDYQYVRFADASYYYHCYADHFTKLNSPKWLVFREAIDGSSITRCINENVAPVDASTAALLPFFDPTPIVVTPTTTTPEPTTTTTTLEPTSTTTTTEQPS